MTSPSIYLILKTVDAINDCGRLGPTFTNRVMAMDPSSVRTLRLYENESATSMIGTPEVLDLDDIATDCGHAQFQGDITDGPNWTKHPLASDSFNRCSPRIEWPPEIQSLGRKYWEHCGIPGTKYGLFDPPGAVPPVTGGLLPSPAPVIVPSTTPAAAIPTAAPPVSPPTPSSPIAEPAPSPAASQVNPVQTLQNQGSPPVTQGGAMPTAQPPTPVAPSPPSSVRISAGGGNVASTYYANTIIPVQNEPTFDPNTAAVGQAPTPIATVAGVEITATPGASTIVYQGQTITSGGDVVTLAGTNIVASLGSSGLIVQSAGGAVTTYSIPAAVPVPTGSIIGTVAGYVITAAPGASSVAIGSQTLVLGGAPITLSGNQVLSLGTNGIVVQAPGGGVQTLPLPTTAPTTNGPGVFIANSMLTPYMSKELLSDKT